MGWLAIVVGIVIGLAIVWRASTSPRLRRWWCERTEHLPRWTRAGTVYCARCGAGR